MQTAAPPPLKAPDRRARVLLRIIPLALLAVAAWVLWREFHHLSLAAVLDAMAAWGAGAVLAAIGLSVWSFLLMGVIEWVGLRWSGARLSWGTAMWGSFIANAIAHSLGANLLVSGAIRVKLYARDGVTLGQVAGATLFSGWAFAVGLSALSGCGLLLAKASDLAATAIPVPGGQGPGRGPAELRVRLRRPLRRAATAAHRLRAKSHPALGARRGDPAGGGRRR